MSTTQTTQDYNFIRAMIKIANPTYTPEQLEEANNFSSNKNKTIKRPK
jgi:hypothetical protein